MRFPLVPILAAQLLSAFPAVGAPLPPPTDANRITFQLATEESHQQLKVYGVEHHYQTKAQYRLCYGDFANGTVVSEPIPLPQLTAAANQSPYLFSTLSLNQRVPFPARSLAQVRLGSGKLQMESQDANLPPLVIPPCTRNELREFGPMLPPPRREPGWVCTADTGADESITVSVTQFSFDRVRATASVSTGRSRHEFAHWDSVAITQLNGGYRFEGNDSHGTFALTSQSGDLPFEASVDLKTQKRNLNGEHFSCVTNY